MVTDVSGTDVVLNIAGGTDGMYDDVVADVSSVDLFFKTMLFGLT